VLDAMSLRPEWVADHRAELHAATGAEAMRAIDAVLDRLPDPARQAAVKFRLASFLAWGTGELEAAEEACRAATALFKKAKDRTGRLLAATELAWIEGLRGDYDALSRDAGAVLAEAEAANERFVAVQALAAMGYAAIHRGRFGEAEPPYRRALEIARSEGMLHQQSRLLAHLALCLALEGRIEESLPLLDEGTSVSPAYRDSLVLEFGAVVNWLAGDFPSAVESAREALAWNPGGVSRRRGLGLAGGGLAAAETGDLAEANRFLAQAQATFGEREWSYLRAYCDFVAGVIAGRDGRPAEALPALRQAAERMPASEAWPYLAFVLLELAETAAECEEPELTAGAAERLAAIADQLVRDLYRGLAGIGRAWAGVAAGAHEPAAEAAREAVKRLSGLGCQGFLGRAYHVLGRSLACLDRPGAVEACEQAALLFEGCSAQGRRNRTLETLRSLGGTGRRAAAAAGGPTSLTRREREVARLAAQGRSAREIAERLYIGERTVETHLANAYAKLGVTSKIDLVRRAADLGL
jgi:ATP/maltotriose-dependent transcriptional regulator MalT